MPEAPMFSPAEFQEWQQARLTQPFRRYLRDQAESLGKQWARGVQMSEALQVKAQLLLELADLDYDDYARFYGIEPETDAD